MGNRTGAVTHAPLAPIRVPNKQITRMVADVRCGHWSMRPLRKGESRRVPGSRLCYLGESFRDEPSLRDWT